MSVIKFMLFMRDEHARNNDTVTVVHSLYTRLYRFPVKRHYNKCY